MATGDRKRPRADPRWERGRAGIIRGRVIGPRFGKALAIAGGGLFAMLVLTCAYSWAITPREANPVMARWIGGMLAAPILVFIGLGIFFILLVRYRRLVIGKERLQLTGSLGRLLGQVPYDNVEDISLGQFSQQHADVHIRLLNRRRKDTWWPRMEYGEAYDIRVRGGFEIDGTALRLLLREAVHEYRARRGLLK
jgi:hypothetical protein